jgi:transcriptional regulator with XRE-family HTH domain
MAPAIRLKEGLVDRLRETRSLNSEEAVARLIGTDRTTLRRIMNGSQPSGAFIASFCVAFGLGMGEAFEIVTPKALAA